MIKVLDTNNKTIETRIERKERLGVVDLPDWSLRVSIAKEELIDKVPPRTKFNFLRYRERRSKLSKNKEWRYDFTNAAERSFNDMTEARKIIGDLLGDEVTFDRHELEIEYVGKGLDPDKLVESLEKQVGLTEVPKSNKDQVYQEIYTLFSSRHSVIKNKSPGALDFNRDLTVQPKTLLLRNLGTLQVVDYAVTEKADGVRNLLYISREGSFLINSANEVSKIKFRGPKGSLVDGECIDGKLFMAFDILVYDGVDVTHEHLPKRLEMLENFVKGVSKGDLKSQSKEICFREWGYLQSGK